MTEEGRGKGRKGRTAALAIALFALCLVPLSSLAQRPGRVRPLRSIRAANGVPPILRRAIQASSTLRYTGRRTVVLMRDGQPNRHEEIVMRDGGLLRVEFPREGTYSGQVIVENETERRQYVPRTNEVRVLPPRHEEQLNRLRALAKAGQVTTEPGEPIAGYPTVALTVRDRSGNPLQRLAIEPDSGLVLGRQVYDATGVQVGGFVFTKIDLNPAPFDPSLFRIERKGVQTTTPWDKLHQLALRRGYADVGLPESTGFRLDGVNLNQKLVSSGVLVQNYTGPGGRLSLYQLRTSVDPTSLRRQGGKRLHALTWMDGGLTFVLLGAQDDATLTRLRTSLSGRP